MNEEFVYVKLITGETIMALRDYEDEETLVVKFPMLVKTHLIGQHNGKVSEQVTAGPYSLFIDDATLFINKRNIVFDSKLSQKAIPHYVHLVQDHEGITLQYQKKELEWDDVPAPAKEEFADIQDIAAAIAQLKAIAQEEVDPEELDKILIEGNKTLH